MNSSPLLDRTPFPSLIQDDQEYGDWAIVTAAAEAAITTTMTQFETPPTVVPILFSSTTLSSIPFFTTTIITTATTSTNHHSPHATPFQLFSFDNTILWHQLFPALVTFAILGVLSVLLLLILLFFCLYRRQRRRRLHLLEENNTISRPPLFGHTEKVQTPVSTTTTLHHLGIRETSNNNSNNSPALQYHFHQPHQYPTSLFPVTTTTTTNTPHYHYFSNITTPSPQSRGTCLSSSVSSTFVPIETSPLTLVPRSVIWQDTQRRRGVNELDLWEQKQQQRQQQRVSTIPVTPSYATDQLTTVVPPFSTSSIRQSPIFTPIPFIQHDAPKDNDDDDDDDDDSSTIGSLDNGRDRPWQRYVQASSRPIDLCTLNDEDDDQHSLHSSSTILHPDPIYNLNQARCDPHTTMETHKNDDTAINGSHGCLENSGSSQWLCPPSTFKS